MISLRLSADLDDKLNQIAENEKISKSEIVKRALTLYFESYKKKQNPYDLGKDLFGKHGSGDGNLSTRYRKILKGKLREKHSR
jgi:hypothetical protein